MTCRKSKDHVTVPNRQPSAVLFEPAFRSLHLHGSRLCFIASCNMHAIVVRETTIEAASDYYLQANRTVHVYHRTAGTVLLLEFGLIGLQHTDLAPAVEEECDGRYPENQDQQDDEGFFGSDNNG